MCKLLKILSIACLIILPYQVSAAEIKDSEPLICSVIKAIDCGLVGACYEGTAESLDLPQFIRVDQKKRMISTTKSSSDKKESQIKNLEKIDGKIFIQGVENGRAWSMIIDETSGKMSATVAEERIGFVIFGACTKI